MSAETALPSDFYRWPEDDQEVFLEDNPQINHNTDAFREQHNKGLCYRFEQRQKAREAEQAKRDKWYFDFMASLHAPRPACPHTKVTRVIEPDIEVNGRAIEGGQRLVCVKCHETQEWL